MKTRQVADREAARDNVGASLWLRRTGRAKKSTSDVLPLDKPVPALRAYARERSGGGGVNQVEALLISQAVISAGRVSE